MSEIGPKFDIPNSTKCVNVGQNSDGGISDFRISGQFLIKENWHNSRNSNGMDKKLALVTKLDNRNRLTSKKLMMTSCQEIVTSLSFFQSLTNLEQSGSQIPDAWSIKLSFSLIVTFYVTKNGNRTKKSLTQLSYYQFE